MAPAGLPSQVTMVLANSSITCLGCNCLCHEVTNGHSVCILVMSLCVTRSLALHSQCDLVLFKGEG
jgi:hypothetical protein